MKTPQSTMKSVLRSSLVAISLIALSLAPVSWAEGPNPDDEIIILLNKRNPTKTLNQAQVRSIYTGTTSFWNGVVPIKMFMLREKDPVTAQFITGVLSVETQRFFQNWNKKKLAGSGFSPTFVKDTTSIVNIVAENPGAIGFARKADLVKAGNFKKVRLVRLK